MSRLVDSHNRIHNYLRISLTDVCNLRCTYCMPEDVHFMPSADLMQADEIYLLAKQFVDFGVRKIRLTGGEPLARKDAGLILRKLSSLPVELTLTSNGVLIDRYLDILSECNIRSVNISLDTLQPKRFLEITKRDHFHHVWNNIQQLLNRGIHVKINVVLMKGVNEDEICEFIALTEHLPIHVRFIEFMPFQGNHWNSDEVVTYLDILNTVSEAYSIQKLEDDFHDTSKKFQIPNFKGTFAIIASMSQPFCDGCNRLRLSADGHLKNCLFGSETTDLLSILRNKGDLLAAIQANLQRKHLALGGQFTGAFQDVNPSQLENDSMVKIGG